MEQTKFDKNYIFDGIIVLQLVLVLVIGWQIYDLNKKISDSKVAAAAVNTNQGNDQGEPEPLSVTVNFDYQISKSDHVLGPENAKVTIVEFSDFECPVCGRGYTMMKQVLEEYKDQIRFVYKHYPLSFHQNAQVAAEAAECAGAQGKFWQMHDQIFENQKQLSKQNLKQWAKDLGLNTTKFNKCLDTNAMADKVNTDMQTGSNYGVSGTPAFFINNQFMSGLYPNALEAFKQVLDPELTK